MTRGNLELLLMLREIRYLILLISFQAKTLPHWFMLPWLDMDLAIGPMK
jgi:hypothetical protein